MSVIRLALAVLPFTFSPIALAQSPSTNASADAAAAPADVAAVQSAIKAALAKSVVFSATVKRDEGESTHGVRVDLGTGSEFSGKLELLLTKEGELVVLSTAQLPELAIYDNGSRCLTRTIVEDHPLNAARLATDLAPLLDLPRAVSGFETGATRSETAGGLVIKGELSKRLFHEQSGPAAMAQPRIKSAMLSVSLDRAQSLAGLHLRVTRTDPFSAIQRKLAGGHIPTDGGTQVFTPGDLEADDTEGATSDYELKVEAGPPSQRSQDLLAAMRKLAAKE